MIRGKLSPGNILTQVSTQLTDTFRERLAVRVFIKALLLFTLVRVGTTWFLAGDLLADQRMVIPGTVIGKVLLAPSLLAERNIDLFYGGLVAFLVVALILKPNYITNAVFFWLVLNLYRVNLPVANGSDIVLLVLAAWCIPLGAYPIFNNEKVKVLQVTGFNLCRKLLQLQIVIIYLISGMDKLLAPAWRSGDAMAYIAHLDTMFNPVWAPLFENEAVNFILSWCTILFELCFALVWFKKTRLLILGAGVLFHIFIWLTLNLPDFAVFGVAYLVFLKDSDYSRVQSLKSKV